MSGRSLVFSMYSIDSTSRNKQSRDLRRAQQRTGRDEQGFRESLSPRICTWVDAPFIAVLSTWQYTPTDERRSAESNLANRQQQTEMRSSDSFLKCRKASALILHSDSLCVSNLVLSCLKGVSFDYWRDPHVSCSFLRISLPYMVLSSLHVHV